MANKLTYATVCSGIECMSAACPDLPLEPVFFSEIEPFPCAVLKSHFPNVPNFLDMSNIKVSTDGKEITNGSIRIILDRRLDIFAGGTPCQDVSVAGKRSGMQEGSGTRSSLAFEFIRLTKELKPRFVIWENVAGVLSDKSFPEFLTALANGGYGVAYRILDAQYIRCENIHHQNGRVVSMERAIPQRRRRVWVIGCLGADVGKVAEILFEPKGVAGDNPPRRRTGQEIAAASGGCNRVHDGMVGEASGFYPQENRGEITCQAEASCCIKPGTAPGFHNGIIQNLVFNKVSHPCGKDGEGERWDKGDVASTRNVFDISETRVQECVVHTTNSNGGDVMPTLDGRGQSANGPGAQEDKRGGYVITRIEKDVDIAMSYDGYNQTGKEECCHTLGTCNSESPNNDKVVKIITKQDEPKLKMVYHESGGNESFEVKGDAMLTLKSTSDVTQAHNQLVLENEQPNVADTIASMRYIVRRLMPVECERLMGLPDGWTIPKNLEVTDELVEEFRIIHDTFKQIMWEYSTKENIEGEEDENGELPKVSPPKPTTHKQVRKWLENITNPDTCPDAPRYKACGNGWATNQPRWILTRLLVADGINPWGE